MKQNFQFKPSLLICIFLIFYSSSFAANPKQINQGQEEAKHSVITPQVSDIHMEDDGESISKLMGLEICDEADEDCLRRRMISEAHLDYIYTQHHKH